MIEKAKEILKSFINEDTENDCFPINPLEEKTRDEIKFVLKAIENLEKELKRTKHNFKNSQTHSKNCYKRVKNKLNVLEEIIRKMKEFNYISIYENNFDMPIPKISDYILRILSETGNNGSIYYINKETAKYLLEVLNNGKTI